jgi:glycosyltransferase involved in cell wall biosynthesis
LTWALGEVDLIKKPMSQPAVSVILPVYNGEKYLPFAIESVLAQTLEDYELIVVDDGSADATADIARSYGSRVIYAHQENRGTAGAFNHGLRLATGRHISWLSHDDMFMPEKLAAQVAVLDQSPGPAVSYTDIEIITPAGDRVTELRLPDYPQDQILRHILASGPIGMASYSICYDRRCIEEVGFYSEYWRYTQDAEMLVRLARRFPLIRVPRVLAQMRESVRPLKWEREVVLFFDHQINSIPFAEIFPELGAGVTAAERSQAYLSMGDTFAGFPYPLFRVAYSLYRRALRESPADARRLVRRMAGLYLRRRSDRRAEG